MDDNSQKQENIVEGEVIKSGLTAEVQEGQKPQTIAEMEIEFKSLINDMESANKKITGTIQMEELKDIGEEVIQAREFLTSFANGKPKTMRDKAYNQLTSLPLIGGWAKDKVEGVQIQHMRSSNVTNVLEGIFDSFEIKKKRLIELTELAINMRESLIDQEKRLGKYITQLDLIIQKPSTPMDKMRALDMSTQARAQDSISKEMIYNQLEFILEMMEALHGKLSKTLPVIKNTLNQSLSVAGIINSMKDTILMLDAVEGLSNDIISASTGNIQTLIIDTTESLSSGIDIDFYKTAQERNEKHHKLLLEAKVKHIKTTVENYNILKNIEADASSLITHREEQMAIELNTIIDKAKDNITKKEKKDA